MAQYLREWKLHYNAYDSLVQGKRVSKVGGFAAYNTLRVRKERAERKIDFGVRAISALTAVDGAVVMTDQFRVLGFGAEVCAQSNSLHAVRLLSGNSDLPIEAFGTRHRSAFRFCSSEENFVAFVVSHDGGVKAVKRIGSQVCLWYDVI